MDLHSFESARPAAPHSPETPERMQAFVVRHSSFFVLVAVLLGQLLLLSFQITRNQNVRLIQVWAVSAYDPFDRSMRGIADGVGRVWRTYADVVRAQKENQQLRQQVAAEQNTVRQLTEAASENQRLRSILDFKNRQSFQTLAAEVIGASPGPGSNAVFIDKGAADGLTSDLAVIAPEGVVGKIISVYSRTSQVLLISDPASGVGTLLEKTRVEGVLKGSNQNLCQLDYVMNDEQVQAGDSVLTSGMDQIYPKGLAVGTVVQVGQGAMYKKILVRPAVALDRLEDVLVVLRSGSTQQQALNSSTRKP